MMVISQQNHDCITTKSWLYRIKAKSWLSVCGSESVQALYYLHISLLSLEIQLSEVEGWGDPFSSVIFLYILNPEPGFPTPYVVVFFVFNCLRSEVIVRWEVVVRWEVIVRGGCPFCWYWWNCSPSLFKLSFTNIQIWVRVFKKVGLFRWSALIWLQLYG